MGTLSIFNFISVNGFYKGQGGDIDWNIHDSEGAEFSVEMLKKGNTLVFGRVTYDMMAGFWSSPQAAKELPEIAEGMRRSEKIVFSRSLNNADWNNTTLIKSNIVEEVKKLKAAGKNMTILGSGSIITQLADAGLIDSYLLRIDPVALGSGTPLFGGISRNLNLKLTWSRTFNNGVVLLNYEPIV